MRIHFENWIKNQNISSRTNNLIDEAIICYRAQAYRAALLFSYLAFQNILKERILSSTNPPEYEEDYWKKIQSVLRKDDMWDSKVIECVERQKPGSIFNLPDDIKRQYLFWKDRRNDCAHAKGNKISISYVESFWLFFESNLSKFGVTGGKESLLERLKIYFDYNLTPKDEDPRPIINDVPLALDKTDYEEFLDVLYKITEDINSVDDQAINFWQELINLDGDFFDYLIKYIKNKEKLCLSIIANDPSIVSHFSNDPSFIRLLWTDLIYSFSQHYKVILALLRHKLIPSDQFEEFVEIVTNNSNDTLFKNPEEVDLIVLEETGFFSELKKLAFKQRKINDFAWARENRHLVIQYIVRYGLDEQIVKAINGTFVGINVPWKLKDSLTELFKNQPQLKEKYKKINKEIDGMLPDCFFKGEESDLVF